MRLICRIRVNMIDYIKGSLEEITPTYAVIEATPALPSSIVEPEIVTLEEVCVAVALGLVMVSEGAELSSMNV